MNGFTKSANEGYNYKTLQVTCQRAQKVNNNT